MPLISEETPSTSHRAPWRGAVLGVFAAGVTIVVIAVVAYATRDGSGLPPRVDAGPGPAVTLPATPIVSASAHDAGVVDAGLIDDVDAGDIITVAPEPPPEPVGVAGPPVVAAEVAALLAPVVEGCLQRALRFDPSLGGRTRLRVEVSAGRTEAALPAGTTAALASCVVAGARAVAVPSAPPETHVVEAVLHLDGLRGLVRVESAELLP